MAQARLNLVDRVLASRGEFGNAVVKWDTRIHSATPGAQKLSSLGVFDKMVDNIGQISKAHPFLSIGWSIVSFGYKVGTTPIPSYIVCNILLIRTRCALWTSKGLPY